ncbi:hypothetical protein [Noviherbaspirillum malthae]|nr:hypothetical protein [Noviherbaspirillum malthae]
MDRARRATHPECYQEDGIWRRGARIGMHSKRYRPVVPELTETGGGA